MAGAVADRELSVSSERRVEFGVARPGDDDAIRALLRANPMRGSVVLGFEREPAYFLGTGMGGAEDETIVARRNGDLACVGRCTGRECWVNGQPRRVGYLAELRLAAAARGRCDILRGGYRFFEDLQREAPADLYFTSIGADNERARRVLERGAPGLPCYSFLTELVTLLMAVPRRPRVRRHSFRTTVATPERLPDLVRALNSSRRDLSAVWTVERLRALEKHGLPLKRFILAYDGGAIVACGALWDQRGFRQTVIRGYAPALAAIRPLANLACRAMGAPGLPPPGSTLSHAFLSPLAFETGGEALLPEFIEAALPAAARLGVEFVTLALPASDPRIAALRRRFSVRIWKSRLYRVDWPDFPRIELTAEQTHVLPEVALL
jgi:hypothetical protein